MHLSDLLDQALELLRLLWVGFWDYVVRRVVELTKLWVALVVGTIVISALTSGYLLWRGVAANNDQTIGIGGGVLVLGIVVLGALGLPLAAVVGFGKTIIPRTNRLIVLAPKASATKKGDQA